MRATALAATRAASAPTQTPGQVRNAGAGEDGEEEEDELGDGDAEPPVSVAAEQEGEGADEDLSQAPPRTHATPWLCRLARAYELCQPAWERFAVRHTHAPARADVFGDAHAVLLAERLRDAIEELACEHGGVRIDAYEQVPVAHVVGLVHAKYNGFSQRDADALHVSHAVDVNVADDEAHAERHGQAFAHWDVLRFCHASESPSQSVSPTDADC